MVLKIPPIFELLIIITFSIKLQNSMLNTKTERTESKRNCLKMENLIQEVFQKLQVNTYISLFLSLFFNLLVINFLYTDRSACV